MTSELLQVYWDTVSIERQGQLKKSFTIQDWHPHACEWLLPPQPICYLSISGMQREQHSASPMSQRDSCSKTHPAAEQQVEQYFPLWAGNRLELHVGKS
jgi:hypothetical protein